MKRLFLRLLLAGLLGGLALVQAPFDPVGAAAELGSPYLIRVTGHDFNWLIRHAGRDGRLDTADDVLAQRNLSLPSATHIRIELESDDYVYSFELPHLAKKEIAVPDLSFALEFDSGAPGRFPLRGNQMCGYAHPTLMGGVTVLPAPEFVEWLDAARARSGS